MRTKHKKTAFTIVELLTVMSIIIILISLLLPSLNAVRRYSKGVVQNGQFHDIAQGLEIFHNEHDYTYPPSEATDANDDPYCGAMKLCEAMVGQDGMGFHPDSSFAASATSLYIFDLSVEILPSSYTAAQISNMRSRVKYIETKNIKACKLGNLYSWSISPFSEGADFPNAVLCDAFPHARIAEGNRLGEKVGMPILYYRADPFKLSHDEANPANTDNIYEYLDNYALTSLGLPWAGSAAAVVHPLYDDSDAATPVGQLFYKQTRNKAATATPRPHNQYSYILISAGWDGMYGTEDDVYNFSD